VNLNYKYINNREKAVRIFVLACFRGVCVASLFLSFPASAQEWIYTVRPGDTLWDVSAKYLNNPAKAFKLQALNAIDDPYHIPPGTTIRVPLRWLKVKRYDVRVISVHGEVELISSSHAGAAPLEIGTLLSTGDTLRTGATGSVALELVNKSQILLNAGTQVTLGALDQYGASDVYRTKVDVASGGVESKVTKRRQPATRFEIGTPAAVTAVRGTDFRVGFDDATRAARLEVISGEVRLSGAGGGATVPSGFGVVASADGVPSGVTKLLPAPDLAGLPSIVDRVPIEFVFRKPLAEDGWRAQITPLNDPSTLIFDRLDKGERIHGPDAPDGRYVLHVRAVDSQGLEGLNAAHVFTLKARPEAPILVYPPPDAAVLEVRPEFKWARNEQAATYHFQLAATAEFSSVLADIPDLAVTDAAPELNLKQGFYYWRVAARSATEGIGPFSDAQRFRIPPPGPRAEPPQMSEHEIAFRWRAGEPGQQYEFQFASDMAFAELINQSTSVSPEAKVSRPEAGRYYVRVRTIDVDGYSGPFGTPQSIDVPPPPPPKWLLLLPLGLLLP